MYVRMYTPVNRLPGERKMKGQESSAPSSTEPRSDHPGEIRPLHFPAECALPVAALTVRCSLTAVSRLAQTTAGLVRGQFIDRYGGSDVSRFFSPAGTPAAARSLPPTTLSLPLRTFEVMKPFEVEAGTVAPASGQFGLGTQYRTPVILKTLIDWGIIREVGK